MSSVKPGDVSPVEPDGVSPVEPGGVSPVEPGGVSPVKPSAHPPDHRSAGVRNGAAATAAPLPARGGKRRRPTSTQWAAWGFLTPVTLYLALFYAYPLYRNIDLNVRDST